MNPTLLATRLVAAAGTAVLLVSVATATSRTRTEVTPASDVASSPDASPPAAVGAPEIAVPSTESPEAPGDAIVTFTDPVRAGAVDPEVVLAQGLGLQNGAWRDLSNGYAAAERPVYIARAAIAPDRQRVEATVTIAWRVDEVTERAVLRLLAGSRAIRDAGATIEVAVTQQGTEVPSEIDIAGARLLIDIADLAAGDATSVTIDLAYDVPRRQDVIDDGGPAAFGLLAWNPDVTALGHWLPLLTVASDDGPMVPWGDVGAFPTATWSVVVEHDGVLVTGGADGPCPTDVASDRAACTWSRATALRDDTAVLYDGTPDLLAENVAGVDVRAIASGNARSGNAGALAGSVDGVALFTHAFGPLAWTEFDVVAVPLSSGAAGMEFPGLVMIDDEHYGTMTGGFGTFVVAHEVAHQWFHALLGNGSLSSPVVDESLAQYLSYLFYVEVYGQSAGDDLVQRSFENRYASARQGGLRDEAPGQRLDEFSGGSAYSPLVYARAPLAWVDAERQLGRDVVVGFLRSLVDANALGFIDTADVIDAATAYAPDLGAVLARYWLDPAPVR